MATTSATYLRALRRVALVMVLAISLLGISGIQAEMASAQASVTVPPIQAVVLIDESGSETAASVAAERDASALLAEGELSNQSSFQFVGFGSSNGPGQSAVVPYCHFITVSSSHERQRAAACAGRAHRRTDKEGNDTDHATALSYAVDQLSRAPRGKTRVIFLLTDGVLDVCRSPRFGRTCDERNRQARQELNGATLPAARRAGIQIWPLGFGGAVNRPALEGFAQGGTGPNSHCDTSSAARPHAVVVGSSASVISGLLDVLGRARCAHAEPPSIGHLSGRKQTLKVTIPIIATDGTITVTKFDPSFHVTYFDPDGKQAPQSGTVAGQTFSLSGGNGRVEALRINNPKPGTWRIEVTNPARHPGQTIAATAVWAGALQAVIAVRPAVPRAGQKATVELRLVTRFGRINSPDALKGISASASIKGPFGQIGLPLRDDGTGSDGTAHDGVFSGLLQIPGGKSGCITVLGRITGQGVAADRRPYYNCPPPPGISFGDFHVTWPSTIHAGDTVSGTVEVSNEGSPRPAMFVLSDTNGALVTLTSPDRIDVKSGTQRYPVSVRFDPRIHQGGVTARLQLRTPTGQTLAETFIDTRVVSKPTLFDRYWWIIVVVVALLAAAIAAWYVRTRRVRRITRVDNLKATLLRNEEPLGETVNAPAGHVFPLGYSEDGPKIRALLSEDGADILIRKLGNGGGFSVEGMLTVSRRGFGEVVPIDEEYSLLVQESTSPEGKEEVPWIGSSAPDGDEHEDDDLD